MFYSVGSNLITQILHFCVRSFFLYILGTTYNGLDGLFGDILSVLSLADLGLGFAMAHTYYKPLAEKDESKIRGLVNLYSKIYFVIGSVVFLAGMALMPFLPDIIKDIEKVRRMGINVEFIFFWYVLSSAISYMFAAYKQNLLIADQKTYIVKNITMIFAGITSVAQIAFLYLFRDKPYVYYLYLISNLLLKIVRNLYLARKCDKIYPFLKVKEKAKILKEDIQKLIKDVYSLFLYRVCSVIMSGTNNIVIARFVSDSLGKIGSYKSYTFLIGAITSILHQIFESITASVGNMIAEVKGLIGGAERTHNTYKALFFANFWLFGMCSVVLWVMLDPFVKIWLKGTDVEFLNRNMIFVLILNFYITGVQMATTAFRNAYGFFQQGKYRPVIMTIVNLTLSIYLAQKIGVIGVFIANVVSRLTTLSWFDAYIVHKYGFKKSVWPFLRTYYFRILLLIGMGYLTEIVVNLFPSSNLLWLILRGIVAVIVANMMLLGLYFNSNEFKFIYKRVEKLVKNIIKRS